MALLYHRPEQPVVHVARYRTEVLKARDGTEHRIAHLGAPVDELDLDVQVVDPIHLRELRGLLWDTGAQSTEYADTPPWQIPWWHEGLVARAPITGASVEVDTTHSEWANSVGRDVIVERRSDGAYYTATITGLSGSSPGVRTLTLDESPPDANWPAWGVTVAELVRCTVEDGAALGKSRVDAGRVRLRARRYYPRTASLIGTGATLTTHDSLPVLDRRPLLEGRQLAQENVEGGLDALDYGAVRFFVTGQTHPDLRRLHEYRIGDAADRAWFSRFFQTVLGRLRPFLLPTWYPDLLVALQPTGTELRVKGPGDYPEAAYSYVDTWWPSLAHRRIMLHLDDGTYLYRTVTAAQKEIDGTESLTLATAVDTSGGSPDVSMISLLETVRLDTDDISTTWESTRATVRVAARVVQQ